MNRTKIDWATMTWNPVTGCFNKCPECYARRFAERFGGHYSEIWGNHTDSSDNYDLNYPLQIMSKDGKMRNAPYPYGFTPTLHAYRINEPSECKKSENIFVCSMADLWHEKIIDSWRERVLVQCHEASWHNYLFLTQNPHQYYITSKYLNHKIPYSSNWFLGTTVKNMKMLKVWESAMNYIATLFKMSSKIFLSIEPINELIVLSGYKPDWVILGAETGNRKQKAVPEKSWIESIVSYCQRNAILLFMKENLAPYYDGELIKEYPARLLFREAK